ncbi:MAG: hypothetical protein ACYC3P_06460 [Bellilinea sp.]
MIELEGDIKPVGELFQSPDVNAAREFFRQKSRAMVDKRMSVRVTGATKQAERHGPQGAKVARSFPTFRRPNTTRL